MSTAEAIAPIDAARTEQFLGKVLTDTSGLTTTVLAGIGDRLGLFKALARSGPATSAELARRTGTQERYVREWASAMVGAGYLEYEIARERFLLPRAHAPVLAEEGGPAFFGGVHQELAGLLGSIRPLEHAFVHGGGVPQEALDDYVWDGIERFSANWFDNKLFEQWLPLLPDIAARLERGATVADVGCGHGHALVNLARAYPRSRFTGYEISPKAVEKARQRAAAAGVAERVHFAVLDASAGIPERFDVITTFDVVHDAARPLELLQAIRAALLADGTYLCLEINSSSRLEDNAGPVGALLYGFSVLLCMTTSLAAAGAGLGTCGLHEHSLRELATSAGFVSVQRLWDDPFNVLYALKA